MAEMLIHLGHLIWRSLVYFPQILSANWLSIILPAAIFFIAEGIKLRKNVGHRLKWVDIKSHTYLLASVYAALFLWAVVHTTYADHKYLVEQVHQRDDLLNSKPALLATVTLTMDGTFISSGKKVSFLMAGINLSNPKSPARAIMNWEMLLEGPHGVTPLRSILLPRNEVFNSSGASSKPISFSKKDNCIIHEEVLDTGAFRSCWVWAHLDIPESQLNEGDYKLIVRFTDVRSGKEITTPSFPLTMNHNLILVP
jgi:hypothetical protein